MLRRLWGHAWWLFIVVGALGCICGPDDDGPTPDSCDEPTQGSVDSVEIASVVSMETTETSEFHPLSDSSSLLIIRGFQGADMVGFRYRLRGADVPSCVPHQIEVFAGEERIVSRDVALATYETSDGRVTLPIWLPGDYPAGSLRIEARVAERPVTVTATAVPEFECAASAVCPCSKLDDCISRCEGSTSCAATCRSGSTQRARLLHEAYSDCARGVCGPGAGNGGDAGSPMDGGSPDGGGGGSALCPAGPSGYECVQCWSDTKSDPRFCSSSVACGDCFATWSVCRDDVP